MTTRRLFLDTVLLPSGWASDVALDIEDGTLTAVSPGGDPDGRERVAGVTLPGLPNLHSHTFQRAMTGLSETRGPAGDDFWTWRQVMYGFLQRLGPDDVEAIAAFAMMEMLEAGFTSVAEFHYLHHAADGGRYDDPAELCTRIAAAAAQSGIGLTLLPVLYTYGGFGAQPPSEGQRRFVNDLDSFATLLDGATAAVATLEDAVVGVAPHSLRAVAPGDLARIPGFGGPIHIHVAEQTREVEDCLGWSRQRPAEWLLDHAPVDQRWCLIHATHTDASELGAIARAGAVIGLCPITEANLGDGIFNATGFRDAGGRFGVGTDSNVEITAVGELRLLEYGQRLHRRARNVMPAAEGGVERDAGCMTRPRRAGRRRWGAGSGRWRRGRGPIWWCWTGGIRTWRARRATGGWMRMCSVPGGRRWRPSSWGGGRWSKAGCIMRGTASLRAIAGRSGASPERGGVVAGEVRGSVCRAGEQLGRERLQAGPGREVQGGVEEADAEAGARVHEAGRDLGHALGLGDHGPHRAFVGGERAEQVVGAGQLAGEDVGASDGEGRAQPGQRRDAPGGVAGQHDAAAWTSAACGPGAGHRSRNRRCRPLRRGCAGLPSPRRRSAPAAAPSAGRRSIPARRRASAAA